MASLFRNPGPLIEPDSNAPQMSQSQILTKLGIPRSQWPYLEGNGLAQRAANQAAARQGLPEPFNPSAANAVIQDLIPFAVIAAGGAGLLGGTGDAAGGAAAGAGEGAAGGAGGSNLLSKLKKAGGSLPGSGMDFAEVAGFLGLISFIFHPLNILRALEVVLGSVIFYVGLRGSSSIIGGRNRTVTPPSVVRRVTRIVAK